MPALSSRRGGRSVTEIQSIIGLYDLAMRIWEMGIRIKHEKMGKGALDISSDIFRFHPLAAITKPPSVSINMNIGGAVSTGGGIHKGVMIGE